eukprot:TRINITY_DN49084_c0_g1_i1.p1 TRINITY_DN49084_c0_g1~~TRINITY_DN49084_c0_g1_i1.p1  ORF type:complete len:537 (+),score=86.32 TRINITY_DN49084_c0_g1_i1:61-1611(+)
MEPAPRLEIAVAPHSAASSSSLSAAVAARLAPRASVVAASPAVQRSSCEVTSYAALCCGSLALAAGLQQRVRSRRGHGRPWSRAQASKTTLNAGKEMRVAVIGAGPAGLAAALAIRKETGVSNVTVFERAPELRPDLGGGLQLHGGAALLESLGVPVQQAANPLRRIRSRTSEGAPLLQLELPELAEKFKPFTESIFQESGEIASCTIMRDQLLDIMAAQLPSDSIQFGKRLQTISEAEDGEGVDLKFEGEEAAQRFDLVIAADGIGSASAQFLQGDASSEVTERDYTGLRIQYGVREAGGRAEGSEQEAHQWFGEGVYALTASYRGRGGRPYEMMAVVFRDDRPSSENIDWATADVREDCLRRLKDAGHGEEVLNVAEGCSRFFELGVYQRPLSLQAWHKGRVVLVGDAAHAMAPFLGQGANQAIQDAYCLARWLKTVNFASGETAKPLLEAALYGYTAQRLPPVLLLSLESNFLGQVETLPGPLGSFVRDNFFKLTNATGVAGLVFLNGAVVRA